MSLFSSEIDTFFKVGTKLTQMNESGYHPTN